MNTTTDRDLWAEPRGGLFASSMASASRGWPGLRPSQRKRRQEVSAGLRAFAAAWFDGHTDETDLPAAFHALVALAEEILGDLDIPQEILDCVSCDGVFAHDADCTSEEAQ